MLNPSTADAQRDDATIRRIVRFTREWGLSGLVVVNLYAWCATDPRQLHDMPGVGAPQPENDEMIHDAVVGSRLVMAAWGCGFSRPLLDARATDVLDIVRGTPHEHAYCLSMTKGGYPAHPLRQRADLRPQAYAAPPVLGYPGEQR
jgi:hypothetical protein